MAPLAIRAPTIIQPSAAHLIFMTDTPSSGHGATQPLSAPPVPGWGLAEREFSGGSGQVVLAAHDAADGLAAQVAADVLGRLAGRADEDAGDDAGVVGG